jgi:glycosyltransferase involved in cell wall biosynthesis
MTIGMLLNAPYPSDVRIKKETDALLSSGFNVCLLCLRRSGEKKEERINGLLIQRLYAGENNVELAFWDVIMASTFIHPVFRRAIPNWIKKNSITALHVHDLPLSGTALSIKKTINIPVVLDFHENYPDALRVWFAWKKNPIARLKNKIFMNAERWTKLEKRASQEGDHIIAVVEEMKQRLIADYSVANEKVTVVSNTEDKSFLNQPIDSTIYKEFSDKFIITYSGNIGPHRGVDIVIEAISLLKDHPKVIFVIVGSGSDPVMTFLKNLTVQYNVESKVFFLGRQPFDKFFSYMRFADANIIPHKSNLHTDNTVPHKLFQAMMVGKPIMVSSCAPLKRIVNLTHSGIVFEADNAQSLAEKIKVLYTDKEMQKQLGENGIKATHEGNWNWEHEQKNLIELYSSIGK